jgi:membrane associated rhomboid family serine protease
VIPLRDENPTKHTPYVTVSLIIINVVVFLYQFTLSHQQEIILSYEYGAVPALIFGLKEAPAFLSPLPWPLTLITACFLHGGFMHLGGNMLYLWIFGNNIEDTLGPIRFIVFYLVGGVIANMSHVITEPSSTLPMIGASGAIAAILGAYLMLFPNAKIVVFLWFIFIWQVIRVPAVIVLAIWFLLQVLGMGGEGVAWMAHIGGFVAGLLMIKLFVPKPRVLH